MNGIFSPIPLVFTLKSGDSVSWPNGSLRSMSTSDDAGAKQQVTENTGEDPQFFTDQELSI
jgi:hypothetical protein